MIDPLKLLLDRHPGWPHKGVPDELLIQLSIAMDTRRMLELAEENQTYIRETMGHGVGRPTESERVRRDGEDAPNDGGIEPSIQGTTGKENDAASGSEPRYHTD